MTMKEDLMKKSLEELKEELKRGIEKTKDESLMYAHLGALGVSPKHMKMYQESIEKINEFNKQEKDREK